MERKAINKKLRFEVFKRDKFICQYCGKKAPDVILHIDHIVALANGGTDDIFNLITSCNECNLGKSSIPLDKNVVSDQKAKQLEELQERREQIEMMFNWKKSLDDLRTYASNLLTEYIENIISPYKLNEKGKSDINRLSKKYQIDEIFLAVDKGKTIYLKYSPEGELIQESVNNFLLKIGGIIFMNRKTPVEAKLYYIKGICKNRLVYYDEAKCLNMLKDYVNALKEKGWNDTQILNDLDTEIVDLAKSAENWSEWSMTLNKWINDINLWDKPNPEHEAPVKKNKEWTAEELKETAYDTAKSVISFEKFIDYISKPFGADPNDIQREYYKGIINYVNNQISAIPLGGGAMESLYPDSVLIKKYGILNFLNTEHAYTPLMREIDKMCDHYISARFIGLYLIRRGISTEKDAIVFMKYFTEYLNSNTLSSMDPEP